MPIWSVKPAKHSNAANRQLAETYGDEAFALWRGAPYAEFADSEYFVPEVRRLTETRLAALDVRLAAGLAQGRHAELVGEAESLCAEYPLREGFWAHLITALYRCGRQADALAACRRVRALLSEEIGADPSAELRMLEQRVLRHDPTLAAPGRPGTASPPLPPELDPAGRLFVGRSDEIEWLRRRWSEVATGGQPLLLAIGGPPGSGRTRLLAEFAAELNVEDVAIHYGELGPGLVVLDDLDELTVAQLEVARTGRTLCVATYDTDRVNPRVQQAVLDAAAEERLLPPLSREDVARVVEKIAGAVDPNLIEEIAVASEGWPGPVERLTRAVVSERSAQLVAAAAAEAGPASRALTAARIGVAAGVRRLTRVRAWPADEPTESERLACPYKGLAAYELTDAPLFHGREDLVASLCARLVDTPFVAVVGPSGAGKSSLVRAGFLPALANGVLPSLAGAPHWVLAPGAPLPDVDGPAVVVVDQFEELFTGPVEARFGTGIWTNSPPWYRSETFASLSYSAETSSARASFTRGWLS